MDVSGRWDAQNCRDKGTQGYRDTHLQVRGQRGPGRFCLQRSLHELVCGEGVGVGVGVEGLVWRERGAEKEGGGEESQTRIAPRRAVPAIFMASSRLLLCAARSARTASMSASLYLAASKEGCWRRAKASLSVLLPLQCREERSKRSRATVTSLSSSLPHALSGLVLVLSLGLGVVVVGLASLVWVWALSLSLSGEMRLYSGLEPELEDRALGMRTSVMGGYSSLSLQERNLLSVEEEEVFLGGVAHSLLSLLVISDRGGPLRRTVLLLLLLRKVTSSSTSTNCMIMYRLDVSVCIYICVC